LLRVSIVLTLVVLAPRPASADWLITPFIGTAFAGETTLQVLAPSDADKKLTFGISGAWLSDGFLGIEAGASHVPGFFSGPDPVGLLETKGSRVTTIDGSLIVAAPLSVTRESLRPYVIGGLGLMQARSDDPVSIFPIDQDFLAVNFGGGAIGMLTPRTGVRFELRHFKAASGADGPFAREGLSRLSFWRASVGVTLRY
jgi:hypothetical protein